MITALDAYSKCLASQMALSNANTWGDLYESEPVDRRALARSAAISVVEHGGHILGRIAFWSEIAAAPVLGLLVSPILSRLADQLDAHSDEIERWVAIQ